MIRVRDDFQIPCVVSIYKNGKCDVYIPDLRMTVHGRDFIDAMADAILKGSAVYYYNIERNVECKLDTTYEQAQALIPRTRKKSPRVFVTFMCLTT